MSIPPLAPIPVRACQVLSGTEIYVSQGVNVGEPLDGPEDVCPGDLYCLEEDHHPLRLLLSRAGAGDQHIAPGSEVGREGDILRLEARYTLMAADGNQVELVILVLPDGSRFAMPLAPMATRIEYSLLKIEVAPQDIGLADLLCISFARGTMITLASGEQRQIERLVPQDRILTRDHGPQPLRWIGQATLRAIGAFAPVVITQGALGNSGDLIVSQHHRMFLYQRQRLAGTTTAELLVQAKHLVDGERIFLREGGFVDYFSLVFDRHEIVYAEGIPAESLLVNETTINRLPQALSSEMKARFPGLSQDQHFGTEAGRQFLDQVGREAVLPGTARPT